MPSAGVCAQTRYAVSSPAIAFVALSESRLVHSRVHATSPALRDLMPYCRNLDTLDITVDNADVGSTTATTCAVPAREPVREGARDRNVIDFCEAFARTRSVRHLVIRKNAYLTQPNAIYVFEQLALAIPCWRKLVSLAPVHAFVSLPGRMRVRGAGTGLLPWFVHPRG